MKLEINIMKKILLGTVALIAMGIAAPASAADIAARPYKAAPIAVPMMYDWSGFYLGVNGGYGWSRAGPDVTPAGGRVRTLAERCPAAGGGVVGGRNCVCWGRGGKGLWPGGPR